MGLYQRYILPRLLDLAMRNSEIARYRAQLLPAARGVALEIGIGSGLNLPFYGSAVEHLYGIDPSAELLALSRQRARGAAFPVELLERGAERLPLANASIDTAVTTFSLCTIAEPLTALHELRRVLKPGASLLFAEHGLAPDPAVERWQHRLNPLWRKLAGGCNLDRRIDALIAQAGFEIVSIRREYAKAPRPLGYIYAGIARRA